LSTMSFSTGTKTENAVYLAFGVVLGLAAVRFWTPDLFLEPSSAIAAALLWGSLLGSIAFLLKLDRLVTWRIKARVLGKYRNELEKQLIQIDIALSIWQILVTETWETPASKAEEKLNRLMDGPSLRSDIWSIKGAFYFAISLPFLFYAIELELLLGLTPLVVLWIVAIILVLYNYQGFLFRCVQLASYLSMQETRSVVQLRKKHKSSTISSSASEPFSAEIVDTVLEELDLLITRQDWKGFNRRITYFLETLEQEVKSAQNHLLSDYVKVWAEAISGYDEASRKQSLIHTKVMKKILNYAVKIDCIDAKSNGLAILLEIDDSRLNDAEVLFKAVDESGVSDRNLESMYSAFYRLTKPPVNSKIVEIVLKWYREGQSKYADHLLSAIEYVDEDLRAQAAHALLNHDEENVWHKAGIRVVRTLLNMSASRVEKVKLLILKGGNRSVVSEILVNSDTDYYELVREVTNYITHEDSSLALSAVEFFMRVETDLMVNSFLPALFKEQQVSIRVNTITFLGRLWKIDSSQFSNSWNEKRAAYRQFLSVALNDDAPGPRRIAVGILKDLKPTNKEREILEIIASDDPADDIRFAARKILKGK
jgi:hypothetical protein